MDWVDKELSTIDLGDKRLNARAKAVLRKFCDSPSSSIPCASGSWKETKATYRLLDNANVTADAMLAPHKESTLARMQQSETILLLQDTTTLNFTGQNERGDTGPIQREGTRGLLLHPMLALTPERLCLGVVSCHQWYREKLANLTRAEKKAHNYERPIESKESYRWLAGYQLANKYAKSLPTQRIVLVSDREGDIYDIYEEADQTEDVPKAYWLTRAHHNRAELNHKGKRNGDKIKESTLKTTPLGYIEFALPNNPSRKNKRVKQAIYAKTLSIALPYKRKKPKGYHPVDVTVIVTQEVDPPRNVKPIEWVLVTNLPIENFQAACDAVQWYTCRWEIELYFKILKSGCKIEKLQLTDSNFDICLRLYMVVAWRILYLTMLGRTCPELDCDSVFSTEEWQTAFVIVKKSKPPEKTISLNEMIILVASMGGYMARKSDPMPGSKTLWLGLHNLQEHVKAREAFNQVFGHTYG